MGVVSAERLLHPTRAGKRYDGIAGAGHVHRLLHKLHAAKLDKVLVNVELRLESHHVDGAGVLVGLTSGEGLGNQLDTGKLEPLVRQALQVGLAPLENNPHSAVTVQVDQVVNLPVGCAEHLPQRLRIDGFVANHPQINTIQRLAFLLRNFRARPVSCFLCAKYDLF